MHNIDIVQTINALKRLDVWLRKNGWAGWDPYDIKETRIFSQLENIKSDLFKKSINTLLCIITDLFPLYFRKVMHVEPRISAKGMGLFLSGYSNLYKKTNEKQYLDRAVESAEWLMNNVNVDYCGSGWGYPFDWLSPILIPKGTPSSVVTAIVGDGFFCLYKSTDDSRYLEVCEKICHFFQSELKITYNNNNAVCYSYTPLDDYQVHNANLFIGEFFTRIGKETLNDTYISLGVQCGNFALGEQQEDGFIPYWGLSQTEKYSRGRLHTDHYHSGFEIRMLFQMWKNTGDSRFRDAYEKYFNWYLENMYENKIIPKYSQYNKYPINIHSCAESILCQSTLIKDHPIRRTDLAKTINWIIQNLEYLPGEYSYTIMNIFGIIKWKNKIPMIRWGQAWMFRALSEVLVQSEDSD